MVLTEDDVNLGAPRLFADEFYVHYLKNMQEASGLSIYNTAILLIVMRRCTQFFNYIV